MGPISRRTFLKASGATATATGLGMSLAGILSRVAAVQPGELVLRAIPDLRDGRVRLWLPDGFAYRSFHDTDYPAAVILDDGAILPGRHDGMGAFPAQHGNSLLVRNHEIAGPGAAFGPGTPYDAMAKGGTTTTEVSRSGEVVSSFSSLNGTMSNCAGGVMPWGSWISCEETVNGPDVGPDFTGVSNVTLLQRHGFIFEVPAGGQSNRQPIQAAGRFAHEGAAWDPVGAALYLTEDNFAFPSGFYRYTPSSAPSADGGLPDDGVLEMARVVGVSEAHLEAGQSNGATYEIDWVTIADPSPTFPYTPGFPAATTNDAALTYVGDQGRAQGAAGFSRLEGAIYHEGEIWFTATQGGGAAETGPELITGYGNGKGQLWSYDPASSLLTCRYQSPGASSLELPDNITASPHGAIVMCEDGPIENYMRAYRPDGSLIDVALNRLTRNADPFAPRFGEEFAGATYSRDGRTLFVNIQATQAVSFAIWGPWSRLDL